MISFKIDPEFRDKIPPMLQEEFDGLRADIIRDGYVRDPLVVWKEENILLDGHNRWRVINENKEALGDKFKVDYKSFPDRWACIAWICANQLHKHNMTEMQRMKLLQEEYEARKKTRGGDHKSERFKNQNEQNAHIENSKAPVLRESMMREHNVSAREMQTAVEVGRGIDRAEEVVPGFKREVLSGETKVNKQDLATIRNMESDEDVKRAVDDIRKEKRIGNWATKETKDRYNKIKEIAHQMGNEQRETTFDDVLRLLNSIEDDFLAKIERTIESEREKLSADERWPDAIDGYFDGVIADINETKRRVLK